MANPKRREIRELAAKSLDQDTRNLLASTARPIRLPKYRLHKASGRAVIQYRKIWGDKARYLRGEYGSPESIAEYRRCIARIVRHRLGNAKPPAKRSRRGATTAEMLTAFRIFAIEYYGAGTREFNHFRRVVRLLRKRFSKTAARKIGPLRLKRVRSDMLKIVGRRGKWSRSYINSQFKRLVAIFTWAVENEFISANQLAALKTVKGLRKGRTTAIERPPVAPVEWDQASRLLPYLSPCVAAMVEVQYLTGMRSDELTRLNVEQMDFSRDEAWLFQPWNHKTAYRDKLKIVCIGPLAQAILIPYLQSGDEYLFSPRVAMRQAFVARRAVAKSKLYGRRKTSRFNPHRYRPRYFSDSYYQALGHGFEKALRAGDELKRWHPHQLRHSRATIVRERYGLEGAQVILGNSRQAAEIYAQKSLPLAIQIAIEGG